MASLNRSFRHTRRHARAALCEALEPRVLLSAGPYTYSSVAGFQGKTNGTQPQGLLMDDAGNLFGVTALGGQYNYGTIFKIPAGTTDIVTLATFAPPTKDDPDNGISPRGSLVLDDAGNLFGITTGGGVFNKGTVWELPATSSSVITLASFNGTNGAYPYAGLVADSAGNLFGTTMGAKRKGYTSTVFTLPAGSNIIEVLATFSYKDQLSGSLATDASGQLAVDSAGNIFGTSTRGGTNKRGSIFQISSAHTLTTLFSFASSSRGAYPTGTLLMKADGDFVGLTTSGGGYGHGSLFEFFASSSTLTTLASFTGSNGSHPLGTLLVNPDGELLGVTSRGGSKGYGTVFEYSFTTSTLTRLYSFSGPSTGAYPTGPLVLDAAGNIWGATFLGGKNKTKGSIFTLLNDVHMTVSALPITVAAGELFTLTVNIEDAQDDLVPIANGRLTVKISSGPTGGKLSATRTVSLVNGVAMFSGLALTVPGLYTLEVSGSMLTSITTDPITVTLTV